MRYWSETPPVLEDLSNSVFYWIRGMDDTGEASLSVVYIYLDMASLTKEDLISKPRLCAVPLEGGRRFYLDSQEDVEGIEWQAIKPPEEGHPFLDFQGASI